MISKNILITGASGYVGSALTTKMLSDNNINLVNYDISIFGDNHLPKKKTIFILKKTLETKSLLKKQ